MPEAVNSVVVGDPGSFSAEHSDREPQLVFVKPITPNAAQSNLLISTIRGLQVSLLLVSQGEPKGEVQADVDFLVRYKPSERFIVQPMETMSASVPQTINLATSPIVLQQANKNPPLVAAALQTRALSQAVELRQVADAVRADASKQDQTAIDELLDRQRRAPLPVLYGQRTGVSPPGRELIRAGVSEVIDQGSTVVVLFSALNAEDHAVELMPPQIQLGGMKKTGKIIRKSRWSIAEQLPVSDFRMSRRRLGPGERADGVVVFQRPSFKQSNETLFLQMAESGAVDRPALAPIGFGITSFREVAYGGR
ncbi:MAG: hypothetical protein LC130_25335 [Bryobacterales bacterium]|nr:hypothetical protein [Bryobacterales bacterium]